MFSRASQVPTTIAIFPHQIATKFRTENTTTAQVGCKLMSPLINKNVKSLVASVSVEHWLCVRLRLAFGRSSKTFSTTVESITEFPADSTALINNNIRDGIALTHAENLVNELLKIELSIKSIDDEDSELNREICSAEATIDNLHKKVEQLLEKQQQCDLTKGQEMSKRYQLSEFKDHKPIEFKKQQLPSDELSMMVAKVPESKNEPGTKRSVFLTESALLEIQSFIKVKNTNEALIIFGPLRSGLTTVLFQVLPRLVLGSTTGLSPVFIPVRLLLEDDPDKAARKITRELKCAADAFGIQLSALDETNKFLKLQTTGGELASGLQKQGRCLWLLIDECQAPLLNTLTVDRTEILQAAMMFKDLIAAVSPHGRCVFTGMGMVTFLNATRELSTDDFDMFNCSKYILLGQKPSDKWAEHFANSIIKQQKQGSMMSELTAKDVLNSLNSQPELFNKHPGLMQELMDFMGESEYRTLSMADRISASMREVKNRVKIASMFDLAVTLETLKSKTDYLRNLRFIASGNVADGVEAASLFENDANFSKFVAMLCGLSSWDGAIRPRMLTPYAHLCMNFICPESHEFALDLSNVRQENKLFMSARFISVMNAFAKSYSLFNQEESTTISDSVTQLLVRHGIGIVDSDGNLRPVRSMFDLPKLQELYHAMCNPSKYWNFKLPDTLDTYNVELAAYNDWKRSGSINAPPKCGDLPIGMMILKSLTPLYFTPEFSLILNTLCVQGFQLCTLESLAFTFETCALKCKRLDFFKNKKDGTLCLNKSQLAKSKRKI